MEGDAWSGGLNVELNNDEVTLLREALDSHAYWQLSDPSYRSSGYVRDPGSDDPEKRDELKAVSTLDSKLAALQPVTAG